MPFKTIRLELARTPEFPQGSARHGYEFALPLDEEGHVDAEAWRADKARCTVRRFWGEEEPEEGYLVHTRHKQWASPTPPARRTTSPSSASRTMSSRRASTSRSPAMTARYIPSAW